MPNTPPPNPAPTVPGPPGPPGSEPPHRYTPRLAAQIETRWQDRWRDEGVFETPNPTGVLGGGFERHRGQPKLFVLDMFPYPSGVGLHVGHPLGYIATDIYARFKRMDSHNVLHAMGYDAFGLPAEQYAVQTGTHPRERTEENIATMRRQLSRLGLAHDPRRSVCTTDVSFYRWTQWIFLQVYHAWFDAETQRARPIDELVAEFESGARAPVSSVNPLDMPWDVLSDTDRGRIVDSYRLAYLEEAPVNWCPGLGTVLANEEVTADGRSERGNFPVYKRPLKQWKMRITAYAPRLIDDLDLVDWPEPVKMMQRNWIGRSEGAFVDFSVPVRGAGHELLRVFTTRPDTLFGATYLVLAPEHPLVGQIVTDQWPEGTPEPWKGRFPGAGAMSPREAVAAYAAYAQSRTDIQRQTEDKEKTGVFTGAYAEHPITGEPVPVFIADYVLAGYGTGAIMAVPAHDERDFHFAQQFDLPIRDVVYSRVHHYVREFARLVDNPGVFPQGWFAALVDFIGLAITENARTAELPALLGRVRQERDTGHDAGPDPARGGVTRGSVQAEWAETLAPFEDIEFGSLCEAFESAFLHRSLGRPFTETGVAVNAELIEGLDTEAAKSAVVAWLEENLKGTSTVTYKLRDWLFSRQRYWGEPFPIVYDADGNPHALPESMLPVELPDLVNFEPESSDDPDAPPRPPLGRAAEWATVTLDLGDGPKPYTRELNTMPQWAGSCWYYLRYLDPANDAAFVDPEIERYWMSPPEGRGPGGVDLYVGGVEHAVLHLLYARFWHKVLGDLGHLSTPEPFAKLYNQGYIQAFAYTDERGAYVEADDVVDREGRRVGHDAGAEPPFLAHGEPVTRSYGKMGKSLKNAVAPDEICERYGADTLRLYEMYLGPLDQSKPWNTDDIVGVYRFLQRVWRNLVDEETGLARVSAEQADDETRRALHKTIAGVREDMDALRFNTAIAKLIGLNNALTKHIAAAGPLPADIAEPLVLMLAPLAPHTAEELWHRLGHEESLAYEPFPEADPAFLTVDTVEIAVQILGKVKARIRVPADADEETLRSAALGAEDIAPLLEGKAVRKVIVVPGRLVNIVAS